jgi:RNase P subunit RPR2
MEKWFCGFDRAAPKRKKMTQAEKEAYLTELTNIQEKPEYKKQMDIQAIICAACCVFLHCFFY